ncbi:MAG TPA: phosphatase PAP2 family protein [Ktedonobacterales bacterium]|nr:phosphatase PAP2 family protein [Ktedonobacterales bacterium]
MRVEQIEVKPSPREEVARLVSAIVHPIAFPLLTLGVISVIATGSVPQAIKWMLVALALVSLPVSVLVSYQVLRGHWTDLDVSVRRQRYALYPFGLACMVALALAYAHFGAPQIVVRASLGVALSNLLDGLINLVYKVSAHATGAAVCATLLWFSAFAWGLPAGLAALAVGWSRVELKRHTPGQVVLGWAVGVLSTLVALHLPLPSSI